jgi:hypothetical protein
LEDVLGIEKKGEVPAQNAAASPGPIDKVAEWAAYELDPYGEFKFLLGAAVERVAHAIMEALLTDPGVRFNAPIGSTAESDAKLLDVVPMDNGTHRIVVTKPVEFAGYWVEFSRATPSE